MKDVRARTTLGPLFDLAGIPLPGRGEIHIEPRMEPLEENPRDDWLLPGLLAMKTVAYERPDVRTAVCIGTGQGVDGIGACLLFPDLRRLYLTDLVGENLYGALENVRRNVPARNLPEIVPLAGRDCDPLPEKAEYIAANLPPLMSSRTQYEGLDRTTLIERDRYEHLSRGQDDPLDRWSLLPPLGFLISAREKLAENGRIVTLLTGRVPFQTLEECFSRAKLDLRVLYCTVKAQTDPEYLQAYADYERERLGGDTFAFYRYGDAREILAAHGIDMPGIVPRYGTDVAENRLREWLAPTRISANEANRIRLETGERVAHVGYALEGGITRPNSSRTARCPLSTPS